MSTNEFRKPNGDVDGRMERMSISINEIHCSVNNIEKCLLGDIEKGKTGLIAEVK